MTTEKIRGSILTVTKYRGAERIEYTLSRGEGDGRSAYSISAVQFFKGVEMCRATAYDVSSRGDAAKAMFDEISSGFVEPYVLCDVVYDLLP